MSARCGARRTLRRKMFYTRTTTYWYVSYKSIQSDNVCRLANDESGNMRKLTGSGSGTSMKVKVKKNE